MIRLQPRGERVLLSQALEFLPLVMGADLKFPFAQPAPAAAEFAA
jgi:hypothetical protein